MTTTCASRKARMAVAIVAAALLATSCGAGELSRRTSTARSTEAPTACRRFDREAPPAKELTRCLMPSVAFVETVAATGSGLVVEVEGEKYILTNLHVVDPQPAATVVLPGDRPVELEDVPVKGVDKLTDIALMGPVTTDRPPVRLRDPGAAKGDPVFLIGYPGEVEQQPEPTITSGIVSRLRSDKAFDIDFIQTDASITGGQSGGALADASGNVIGVSGLGFAEEFALVLDATEADEAIGRILGDDPDDYWTFPPREGQAAAPSGTAELVDTLGAASLFMEAADGPTTLDLTVTSDAAPPTLAVDDFDTGESIFFDRGGLASFYGTGEDPSPEDIEQMVSDLELVVGDPVGPGHWVVDIPADTAVWISLAITEDRPSTLTWSSTPGLYAPVDEVRNQPLAVGEQVDDTLDYLESSASYTVDLVEGTTYEVSVDSNANDPGVSIAAPGASVEEAWWAADDGGIYGLDAHEDFTAEATGPHRVLVENYGGAAMVYRLEISEK